MKNSRIKSAALMLAAVLGTAAPRIAHACAMCGLAPGDHAGHAYNTSVLFMLVSPYVSFFAIGGIVVYAVRRARRSGSIEK